MTPSQSRARAKDASPTAHAEFAPDDRVLTERQSAYLAELTGVADDELVGRRIGDLHDILRWKIDPQLLLFRRVCGRVVRTDPVSGVVHGVPNATVHVEDTDCSFLGYFPVEQPWWWWLWPISCHTEELATTLTDQCGHFCVWVPRWDIDRILRIRRRRICFDDILKPNLSELLERYREQRPPFPPHPDPGPLHHFDREALERLTHVLPSGVVDRLIAQIGSKQFGGPADELDELLAAPAFATGDFQPAMGDAAAERAKAMLKHVDEKTHPALQQRLPIGPFWRCHDVFVPEWITIFDTPDITFRVTQDVDLDGDEETIYDEGLFDVRWNAGDIPNVVLQASPIARVSHICDGPSIPCGDEPAIRTVGLMPLEPTHHDSMTGYALRVNKPRPPLGRAGDPPTFPAQTPYAGTLQLHGCHHLGGAMYYRLLYAVGAASEVPFTGLEWWAPRLGPGAPFHIVPDADGWYPVLPESDLVFPHWLLNWPTTVFGNGTYRVRLELGNASKGHIAYSDPVAFTVDNTAPAAGFSQLRWREVGGAWLPQNVLPFVCPTIARPHGADLEIEVTWFAHASHFRDARLSAGGCGGGAPLPDLDAGSDPEHDFFHWHVAAGDNAMARVAQFTLDRHAPQGCYTFTIDAHSRAFNPAGDGGGPGADWNTDYSYLHAHPSIAVAVIDA